MRAHTSDSIMVIIDEKRTEDVYDVAKALMRELFFQKTKLSVDAGGLLYEFISKCGVDVKNEMDSYKYYIPIKNIAHNIGMQNQYLHNYVADGDIDGIPHPTDYHSEEAKVCLNSLLKWVNTRVPLYWSEAQWEKACKAITNKIEMIQKLK